MDDQLHSRPASSLLRVSRQSVRALRGELSLEVDQPGGDFEVVLEDEVVLPSAWFQTLRRCGERWSPAQRGQLFLSPVGLARMRFEIELRLNWDALAGVARAHFEACGVACRELSDMERETAALRAGFWLGVADTDALVVAVTRSLLFEIGQEAASSVYFRLNKLGLVVFDSCAGRRGHFVKSSDVGKEALARIAVEEGRLMTQPPSSATTCPTPNSEARR